MLGAGIIGTERCGIATSAAVPAASATAASAATTTAAATATAATGSIVILAGNRAVANIRRLLFELEIVFV